MSSRGHCFRALFCSITWETLVFELIDDNIHKVRSYAVCLSDISEPAATRAWGDPSVLKGGDCGGE